VGESNKLAFTSAELVTQQPGSLSPLLVHGASGVGKTHLLEGICSAIRRSDRGLHAIYLTAEQFTTLFLEALGGRGLPSFRQKYRGVDVLLIDDVQFFAGKRATLVELLYTVDTLLKENRQLVFASDRPPAELHALGPELVARLTGGLVCRVETPDYAVRLGIVRNLAQRLGMTLSEEVVTLVASHVTTSARELCGALKRLQVTSVAHGQPITRALAEQALAELSDQTCRPVQLPDIQKAVCNVFGIEPENLRSKRKVASVSHPRMLAMWLARKHTRAALSEIGHFFGRRSHSSVISAQKNVERWLRRQERLTLSQRSCDIEEAIRKVEETLRRA
jgi:chromosomal replication initiator protein